MPVKISDGESLAPFFAHIGKGRTFEKEGMENGYEAYYGVGIKEWYVTGLPSAKSQDYKVICKIYTNTNILREKGMLYEDGRMDLCKM